MYPFTQRLEPNSGVPFKSGYLLLGGLALGHKGVLPFKVRTALYVLLNIEVGKAADSLVYVGCLCPEFLNGRRGNAFCVRLVLVCHRAQFFSPFLRQDILRKHIVELSRKYFLADIGRGAGASFFSTAIIDIAMDISVLLMFRYHLGGDGTAAIPAPHQTAKSSRLFLGFLNSAPQLYDFLHSIKKPLFNDGGMYTSVYFPAVSVIAVIKSIGENFLYRVFFDRFASATVPTLNALGSYASLVEKSGYVLQTGLVLGVAFKCRAYDGSFAPVNINSFGLWIVEIPDWRNAGKFSPSCFLVKPSFYIRA